MTRRHSTDPSSLTHPPAEVLDTVARTEVQSALRRLGVPASMIPDALQNIITTAYFSLHGGGRSLPLPAEDEPPSSRVKAFLTGIARRHASDIRRRGYQRREVPAGLAADVYAFDSAALSDLTPEQRAASEERLAIIVAIVMGMPPEQAEVLLLHALGEMTVPEIAARQGINENTVKSRLARARAHARDAIQNLPAEERRLLERSPVMAFAFWGAAEEVPPESRRRGLFAALVVLAAGFGLAGGPVGSLRRAPEPQPAIAAEAPTPVAPPVALPSPPRPALSTALPPPAAPPRRAVTVEDTLAAERVLISAARRALRARNIPLASAHLTAHEQRFPQGKLAGVRDQLRGEASP